MKFLCYEQTKFVQYVSICTKGACTSAEKSSENYRESGKRQKSYQKRRHLYRFSAVYPLAQVFDS